MPTSYYGKDSGVGLAILNNPRYGAGLRVGVLGLGVGTLAAYGQPQDSYRFYEINPVVIDLANGQDGLFSFVKDSLAHTQIIEGDARISLEKELAAQQANNFDILVLDTFSSDSSPVHLGAVDPQPRPVGRACHRQPERWFDWLPHRHPTVDE